ncbi:MAG TPA: 2-phospho-L-lactate transferase [Methanoregulaceae archaeon]|nr:2-phospho-L-lactate transferase [Methanoregulaceae archaeon]
MITFLSGGTGTPKLIRGMRHHLPDDEMVIVVNTAEDIWMSGNHLSPDVDTVMYLFSGHLNTDTWWGVKGDTFRTHDELRRMGVDEYIGIGDLDRAVHIARGDMLRKGASLTEATRSLCSFFGVAARILPMSDDEITTMIRTGDQLIHFQEFWIKYRGKLPIDEVVRASLPPSRATSEVVDALCGSDVVIIGPSNPITSILPILECQGVLPVLKNIPVVAVSPFIGDAPISGPAAELMRARGFEPNSRATHDIYGEFLDLFIQDIRDPIQVPGSVRLDTLMTDDLKSSALAAEILACFPPD